MSVERDSTREPNPCPVGEGRRESSGQQSEAAHRSGGVSVVGMSGMGTGVSQEVSGHREPQGTQPAEQAAINRKAAGEAGEVGVLRSSVEARESTTRAEPREGTCVGANQSSEGPDDGWEQRLSLLAQITTPPKVRKLQRALYRKAKAEPRYRFYSLYGELSRLDLLETALNLVVRNGGCAGVDGQQIQDVLGPQESRRAEWLQAVSAELKAKQYCPQAVRRVHIPKGNGQQRPLGIPTVKDRVVQAAAMLVLLPIFEADLHPQSYAYRPGKNAHQAMSAIVEAISRGNFEVIDADLSSYFDSIPHAELMALVARRVSDGAMLALIRSWLQAPIEEQDPRTGQRRRWRNRCGTPQGGVISPLLANLYLNGLDWAVNERCELRPTMVRYADDFVILCRTGQGTGLLARLKRWLQARGLKLNEAKTRLVDIRQEGIQFLGFGVSWRRRKRHWSAYAHVEPHFKSQQKLRDKLQERLNHWTQHEAEIEVIQQLNRLLKGWQGYFRFGNPSQVFGKLQYYVNNKVRQWLWRRHGCTRGKYKHYSNARLQGAYRLFQFT
jgi:RNA-directed DNA polymerase